MSVSAESGPSHLGSQVEAIRYVAQVPAMGVTTALDLSSSDTPPYSAPSHTIYPSGGFPNPHVNNLQPRPVIAQSPPGQLFRPGILPADTDDRLAKSNIWITVDDDAVPSYFVPSPCVTCSTPAVAQFCDRAWPKCERCATKNLACPQGASWVPMRPRTYRRNLKAEQRQQRGERPSSFPQASSRSQPHSADQQEGTRSERFSSAEKGKGKHVESAAQDAVAASDRSRDVSLEDADLPISEDVLDGSGGRGKRIKKKRRLSAADEIAPSPVKPNAPAKKSRPSTAHVVPKKERPDLPAALPLPPQTPQSSQTRSQKEYNARLITNRSKPALDQAALASIPVWADTHRALLVCSEYLNRPSKTHGASVEIGAGGLARGLILEGVAPGYGNYWRTDNSVGSIIINIGKPRKRWIQASSAQATNMEKSVTVEETLPQPNYASHPRPTTPPTNLTPSVVVVDPRDQSNMSIVPTNDTALNLPPIPSDMPPPNSEEPEIDSLLMAQRARTPVAIVVSEDYSLLPFNSPYPLVTLGWFWVVDAWLEPVSSQNHQQASAENGHFSAEGPHSPTQVRWKFRFEWCPSQSESGKPWWIHSGVSSASQEAPTPKFQADGLEEAWQIAGPGSFGSTTTRAALGDAAHESLGENETKCLKCSAISRIVYNVEGICLNESCPSFFAHLGGSDLQPDEIENVSDNDWCNKRFGTTLAPFARTFADHLDPSSLGLKLVPAEIAGPTSEMTGTLAGRDFWRGWVCSQCRHANERRKWSEWDCGRCERTYTVLRRIYTAAFLRPPLRPVCTGPRQDMGHPSWPYEVKQSWMLYKDDIRVMKHLMVADDTEIQHALGHEGKDVHLLPNSVLRDFQAQGSGEIDFERHVQNKSASRVEQYLSPFYTISCGPSSSLSQIESLPASPPIPWQTASTSCLDIMDLINERAGRLFPGEPEFNSLLIAACPPNLVKSAYPKIVVPPLSELAIATLGSDGSMLFRPKSGGRKSGSLSLQHGDVICVKTKGQAIEVQPSLEGFGFLCIARKQYETKASAADQSLKPGSTSKSGPKKSTGDTAAFALPEADALRTTVFSFEGWYIGHQPIADIPTAPPSLTHTPLPTISALLPLLENESNIVVSDDDLYSIREKQSAASTNKLKYGYIAPSPAIEPTIVEPPETENQARKARLPPVSPTAPTAKKSRQSVAAEAAHTTGKSAAKAKGRKGASGVRAQDDASSEVGTVTGSVDSRPVLDIKGKRKSKVVDAEQPLS